MSLNFIFDFVASINTSITISPNIIPMDEIISVCCNSEINVEDIPPITLNMYVYVYVPIGEIKLPNARHKIAIINIFILIGSNIIFDFSRFLFFINRCIIASAKYGNINITVMYQTEAWKFTINTDIMKNII